jgi:hypothetical protein
METQEMVTVEASLAALSDALSKAADDLRDVRATIDLARTNIASHNTSVSRDVVKYTETAVVHLRQTDESLRRVVKELFNRD